MALVTTRIENNHLYILPNGRIDSSNATSLKEEINDILKKTESKNIIMDAEDLDYISSAGLRTILSIKKQIPDFSIINVKPEVYDVFEMTGFTSMMPIRRAFRKMNLDGCHEIARGAKGAVYRYDADTVVKQYFNADSLPNILKERELAKKAFILGIPTAISYDVVQLEEGYGSVFELLDATTYSECISEHPDDFKKYTDYYADLLRQIHKTEVDPEEMPDYREITQKWFEDTAGVLSHEDHQKIADMVNELPNVHNMIHGDYHTNNLMLQNGETLLIDMDTLSHGHPIFDLANIYFTYVGFATVDPDNVASYLGMSPELAAKVWEKFLPAYLKTDDPEIIEDVNKKAALLGTLRVLRHIARRNDGSNETAEKIETCKKAIHHLLEKVDQLNY